MSFRLPLTGTSAREMLGDLNHVVDVLSPQNRRNIPSFGQALIRARKFIESDKAISRHAYICLGNCNIDKQYGQIVLISVGRRGGWRLEHVFGDCR